MRPERDDSPKFNLGDLVDFTVTAQVAGVDLSKTIQLTVVGCKMSSDTDKRIYYYDLSLTPPEGYFSGTVNFRNIAEKHLTDSKGE